MNVNFSEMTQAQLCKCGRDKVSIVMGIYIRKSDVIPLEASARNFYFRIGEMYFDLIANDKGTTSLYVSADADMLIASFNADGYPIRG